jgi:SAM-dependent methyltransferase
MGVDIKYRKMVEVYNHYVEHSREIVSQYTDAVVLKTDGWNETLSECRCGFDVDMPVLGRLGAKEEYSIEIIPERAELMQKKCPSVKVVNGDLTTYDFGEKKFDVILDLSTIDHIHPLELQTVLNSYGRWLKDGGTMWLVVWLSYHKRWREVERGIHPGHQYYFGYDDFKEMLGLSGFRIKSEEGMLGSRAAPFLISFTCKKV